MLVKKYYFGYDRYNQTTNDVITKCRSNTRMNEYCLSNAHMAQSTPFTIRINRAKSLQIPVNRHFPPLMSSSEDGTHSGDYNVCYNPPPHPPTHLTLPLLCEAHRRPWSYTSINSLKMCHIFTLNVYLKTFNNFIIHF